MKFKSKTLFSLLTSCTMVFSMSGAYAADPLYQWNFNGSDGTNSGTGTGGALTTNVGGATTASLTQTGPSGEAWDHSLYTNNANDIWWGTDLGNAASGPDLDLTTVSSAFTITMWVKRGGGNNTDLLNIGDVTTPGQTSNPGISIGLNGNWDNGMRIGVNGYNAWVGDLWSPGYDNDWCFVAICYDGNGGVWWDETMNSLYGHHRNAVVVTGDTTTAASVVAGLPLHIGDWGTPAGPVALSSTATAYLANNGAGTTGFSGNLDDVRIYSGLLTVPEIEAIRQSAFAEPSPAVDLYWKGDVDDSWASLNWTSDIDGTIPGGALPTDGSAGVAFTATGASNPITTLSADQNVRNIVVMPGSGSIDIGGSHSLTIGADGIWSEQTAGSLLINTAGGIILDTNQIWKNKSPNPIIVDSSISGSGTLTKSGTGQLRLGGDNSARTAGTVVELGTLALDNANALGSTSASLTMNNGTLDLNGNSITLGALAGNGDAVIHNTSGTACSLTLDVASSSTYSCKINDGPGAVPVSLIKKGAGSVTSNSAGNFTGPVTIEDGQFIAIQPNWGAPNSGSLGNCQVPGRVVTVTSPGTLALNFNNIFGNNFGDPTKLPEVVVNETTVSATNYNLIGDVTLNASTLSQSTTNAGPYQGYQFRGVIKVTGTTGASVISGSGGNHLSPNTIFEVENSTLDAADDLIVSTPLINPSGDFAATPTGGLTKTGFGTMVIMTASTYTGNTVVSEGVLSIQNPSLSDTGKLNVAADGVIDLNFVGSDTVDSLVLAGANQPAGTYGAVGSGAEFETPRITGTGLIIAGEPDPFVEWIATYPSLTGLDAARGADPDGDGMTNIQEFAFNSIPNNGAASGKIRSSVETIASEKALVLTLPVRNGAVFSGVSPAISTLVDEQISYHIEGTNDLSTFDQAVSEVVPAASSGLPALDAGWSYRSFRLNGNIGGGTPRGPRGFLRSAVVDNAP